jgi:hypothetical protein
MAKKATKYSRSRRKVESDNSWRKIALGTVIALGVIALGILLYLNLQEPEALSGLARAAGLERAHDEDVVYAGEGLPPMGGVHSGTWQNCGIYDEPVDAKHAVHSLEHGAVWVTYHPDLPEDGVEALRDVVSGEPFVLMSPFEELRSPVVLTAWGIQLEVDSADDDRIATFIERYERGPQTPEPGAICHDGTGTPIG